MRLVVAMAETCGAERLIDIESAHVDSCLYHGQASLDFAERLAGGRVAVPTTLNVGLVDLVHPDLYRGDPETGRRGRRLMELYAAMGCRRTYTCAPYQLPVRPAFGQHVAWAESNAIVFANSVLGARTDRYGDFIDICAALTGRVPDAGLHRDEHRAGQVLFDLAAVPERLRGHEVFFPVLGHVVGREAGSAVAGIDGLPRATTEDQLKALGAAAAASGAVAMFHAVGVTPEAPTLEAAFRGSRPETTVVVTPRMLAAARDELSTGPDGRIAAVSMGTPHMSIRQVGRVLSLLDGMAVHQSVHAYASMGRAALREAEARGWAAALIAAGVTIVSDTCTYIAPVMDPVSGPVMTDSAKWAYYAPGNLGVEVVFGSLEECVRSATLGRVWRDPELWGPL
jgi:predicted aconitase